MGRLRHMVVFCLFEFVLLHEHLEVKLERVMSRAQQWRKYTAGGRGAAQGGTVPSPPT